MKLFIGGSPIPLAMECDFEDAWEEIEDYPNLGDSKNPDAFIGLENENHHYISIVHLEKDEWGVIFSGSEKRGLNTDDLKKIIADFYDNKVPNWAVDADRNDFPDGIDDILDDSW